MGAFSLTSPNPRRRLGGTRARGNGAAFESWLAASILRPLVERGHLIRFDKLDAPTRATWDSARSRVVFVPIGVGGADFLLLAPGGRYLACECKSTDGDRFYRTEIEPHQIAHPDATVSAGGGAYLALQFRDRPTATAYLVPWQSVPWATARTAPSCIPAALTPWALRNWLDAARILGGKL